MIKTNLLTLVACALIGFYSYYANIQTLTIIAETETLRSVFEKQGTTVKQETVFYSLDSIEGAGEAASINIKIIWFLLCVNIIIAIVSIVRNKKVR